MTELTIGQRKVLQDMQDYFEYAKNSQIRKDWAKLEERNSKYYYDQQWQSEELKKEIESIGGQTKTFNKIRPTINKYISLLVKSGKRIGFSATTDSHTHQQLAEYLKHWAFNTQTQNNHTFFASLKAQAALVSGIGWSHFGYENGKFFYDYVDNKEIYWDPDDPTPRLENQNFICRSYYVHVLNLKKRYPKHSSYFDNLVQYNTTQPDAYNNSASVDPYSWTKGKSIRIVEVFYKKEAPYFETEAVLTEGEDAVSKSEQVLATFYKDHAEAKSSSGEILVKDGTQIFKGTFCQDVLLEHGVIPEQIPNQKYLPIIPMVLQRDYQGMPYAIVNSLISPQDTHNMLLSSTLHYLDTKMIVGTNVTNDIVKLSEMWKKESRTKNGAVFMPDVKDVQIVTNDQNIEHRLNLLRHNNSEFESLTGLHDEFEGKETNAVSGVAIQQRTINTMNAQNPLMLAYEHMLISEGTLMLDTLKGIKDLKYVFKFYKDGQDNAKLIDETISLLNFEVYPDAAPNFSSSVEEEKARFVELLNSPSVGLILSSPIFLQEIGFRETSAYKLADEYLRITSAQNQIMEEGNE